MIWRNEHRTAKETSEWDWDWDVALFLWLKRSTTCKLFRSTCWTRSRSRKLLGCVADWLEAHTLGEQMRIMIMKTMRKRKRKWNREQARERNPILPIHSLQRSDGYWERLERARDVEVLCCLVGSAKDLDDLSQVGEWISKQVCVAVAVFVDETKWFSNGQRQSTK